MRALLVANPRATGTDPWRRDVLVRALGSELKLDVEFTRHRGHATALAAQARSDGLDLVIALGGDGTVNEVVNGLLRGGARPDTMLGVIPAGDANVFARDLGIPRDPVHATSLLLECVLAHTSRLIGLGQADGRYFTFTAGLGLDAGAVRQVETARRKGRRSTPTRYLRGALRDYARSDRRHPTLRLTVPGEAALPPAFVAIVSKTSPWTYFRSRPVVTSPHASYEAGLDLLALSRFGPLTIARTATGMLADGPQGPGVLTRHDLPRIEIRAVHPTDFQVDGEYLGERTSVTMAAVPRALRVAAPV